MKIYISLFIAACFFLYSHDVQAQSTERQQKVDHTLKNNILDYSIPIKAEGLYSVAILKPSGELLSWPIKDQKLREGSTLDFDINSKYWESGNYRLQIMRDEQMIDVYTISVGLSPRERKKLEE